MLAVLRERSRDAAPPPAPTPTACDAELAACAAARRAKDLEACLASARAALRKDEACGKAWFFLCWSLFELRRYDEASTETRRALGHRRWSLRDREGMAALRTSCELLARMDASPGEQLRDEWYRKRLRALWESGALVKYEREAMMSRNGGIALGGIERFRGASRDECSLLDNVPADGLRDVRLGGDGGERDVPSGLLEGGDSSNTRKPLGACFEGDKFPLEQAVGGVIFLKSAILPFHCDRRFGVNPTNRRQCYVADGPCRDCQRFPGFPVPTHRFPAWDPVLPGAVGVTAPHAEMDVLYSTDAVAPSLHAQLCSTLDALAAKRGFSPMPQYRNIIDPNVNSVDGLWVPAEFDVSEADSAGVNVVIQVELACVAATGKRLPFGFGTMIAVLASEGKKRAQCRLRSPIADLDAHEHVKLHAATQRLMTAALPLLAKLRRPALLLPGPLQAVVKAQRIEVADGEEYAGVWHEDGMGEHVVAVVLYYYRASPTLTGGALEFCSKQRQALWSGDGGGADASLENATELASSLPRCQVPVKEGTLVVFSNYAAVHRVLRIAADRGDSGSRDFVAFFVIDQRHPLPTPRTLPPRAQRMEAARTMLAKQLQPRGAFGLDSRSVYSTGNGSAADVGWVSDGGDGGERVAEAYPDAASLIDRLNIAPPRVERGLSMALHAPRTEHERQLTYNPESTWAELWVGEGDEAEALYVDLNWGSGVTAEPPIDGVSSVLSFPSGMRELARYVEEHGYYCDDPVMEARLHGTAIELVVDGKRYHFIKAQLQGVAKLRALQEGSRCDDLEAFLDAYDDDDDEGEGETDEFDLAFVPSAWPIVVAYLHDPSERLAPHDEYLKQPWRHRKHTHRCASKLFDVQVNARELGCPALFEAAAAARREVEAVAARPD